MRAAPIAAALGLALTAALSGCTTGTDDSTWNLGAFDGDLIIEVAGAGVEIREAAPGGTNDTITVTRHTTAGREVEADPVLDGNALDLTAGCGFILFGDCTVDYEITVPSATRLSVKGDSGSVTAIALGAKASISTDNGAITVQDATGPLDLRTDNGAIVVAGASSKSVAAVAANGAINLSIGVVPDHVSVATENGAVTVAVPTAEYQITTATDSGDVDNGLARAESSPHRIEVTTENGPIRLLNGD